MIDKISEVKAARARMTTVIWNGDGLSGFPFDSHRRLAYQNGTVCQDCSQSCEKTECRLVVVCDGHGGADYFRSDRGSKLAAVAFMDCMENPDLIAALSAAAAEKQRQSRMEQLIKSIIARWNSLVEQDMRQHPFEEDELSGVSEKCAAQI